MSTKTACTTLVLVLLCTTEGQTASNSEPGFIGRTPREFQAMLEQRRPAPLTAKRKLLILNSLPRDGRVAKLAPATRRKLASVQRVLQLHSRESQYEMVVIDIPQATVGLYERMVVLISKTALGLLQPEELQAVVAHEIGHEYVWDDFQSARKRDDARALRELEVWCDAVAVLTLRDAEVDPAYLASGLRKLRLYNLQHLGRALNEDSYPTLGDRERLLKDIIAWAGR